MPQKSSPWDDLPLRRRWLQLVHGNICWAFLSYQPGGISTTIVPISRPVVGGTYYTTHDGVVHRIAALPRQCVIPFLSLVGQRKFISNEKLRGSAKYVRVCPVDTDFHPRLNSMGICEKAVSTGSEQYLACAVNHHNPRSTKPNNTSFRSASS